MIETIHIFDEFSQSPEDMTAELRHSKRMALEPLIYGILHKKYGRALEAFWATHVVPPNPDSYIVLIERRLHPNLAFVLQNAAYFAKTWGIVLICSDQNYEYCKELCRGKAVDIRPLFRGNPDPATGKLEYNTLLKTKSFYESLPGDYHIFLEVDCYIRKPIPDEWKEYDLIAAPYEWDETAVGGGIGFRKKSASLDICSHTLDEDFAADAFLCKGANHLGLKIPSFEKGITYVAESCLYEDPIGVHQWWTFFFPHQAEDAEEIFQSLLSLEIN